ncbi:unnamed protein product, partial [Rotaria magnacalcarata]
DDENSLNGFQWEQLISTYIPTLNVLKFRISTSKKQLNAQLMGSFQTEFWIQHKWFVDFDDGILYTTTYMKRELTLSCGRNMLSLLPGVSNRYDHLETLALNFSTDFQWSAEALSSFVFPNVCHLSLSFPEDYYGYDRHGSIKVDLFDFMFENRQLFKNIQHLIIVDTRQGIIDIKNVEKFIRIFDDYRLLKVLEIEVNDKYSFPVLRLLLN